MCDHKIVAERDGNIYYEGGWEAFDGAPFAGGTEREPTQGAISLRTRRGWFNLSSRWSALRASLPTAAFSFAVQAKRAAL